MKKTLIVDGDNLFKIGYHGVRDFYHKGKHIGGIYHVLNTIRRFIDEYNYDKVLVFWDGEDNTIQRRRIYPEYKNKTNKKKFLTEAKKESFDWQKNRIKQYLEEAFVRQIEVNENEADDLISYYCSIAKDEQITIFSGDKDLTQLISENVSIYSPNEKKFIRGGDLVKLYKISVPHQNVKTVKILSGDSSDNIHGIYYMGETVLSKLFPEILERPITIEEVLSIAEEKHKEDKDNRALQNILSGKSKLGVFGEEFFIINKKLIDLDNPLITDEGKEVVNDYYHEAIDPDGRSYKNLMRFMNEDGIFKYLPKRDSAWVDFIRPFLKLTRKEKNIFKQKN